MPRQYGEDVALIKEIKQELGAFPMILNIGSGPGKLDGYLNVDKFGYDDGVDVVEDLDNYPWSFNDNQFDLILCNHYIEHVHDIVRTMEEIHRVGKPGGQVVIRTPYFANYESFRDPTHRWHLAWESFDYFVGGFGDIYTKARFELMNKRLSFAEAWRNPGYYLFRINSRFYEKYFSHLLPGTWLYVHLKVKK